MWVQYRWYIVTGRCVPDGMVRIEGLDRFLTSIRRRVKHVKGSFFNDFWCRACVWADLTLFVEYTLVRVEFWRKTDLVRLTVVKWLKHMLHPQEVTVACTTCNGSFHRLIVIVIHASGAYYNQFCMRLVLLSSSKIQLVRAYILYMWWGLGLTHARHPKSLKKDPFTCFTRRRIDVRKRFKPSILTIPSGTHLPVTIYQRYWTHIVVLPPLEHFSNVPLTGLGTVSLSVLARRGSRVGNQWKCV